MNTDIFKSNINIIPKSSSDINIIFSIAYSEYQADVVILNTLSIGSVILQNAISSAILMLNDEVYGTIIKGLSALNAIKKLIPNPVVSKMDKEIGIVGDILAAQCTDYMNSLPEELFNILQDIQYLLETDITINLGGLTDKIVKSIIAMKNDALIEVLGSDTFNTIISPLIVYNDFLIDNDIMVLVNRLDRLERCMTKPGIANVPKSYFIEPTSKKLYSVYFRNLFMMDYSGGIDIRDLGSTSKSKSQISNLISSLNNFRLT